MSDAATLQAAPTATWGAFREWRRSKCPQAGPAFTPAEAMCDAAMGLMGEAGEVCDSVWHRARSLPRGLPPLLDGGSCHSLVRECGDVLFYADWLADCFGLGTCEVLADPDSVVLNHGPMTAGEFWQCDLLRAVGYFGKACDLAKKQVFHGVWVDRDKMKEYLRLGLVALGVFLACFDASLGDAARAVVGKLDARYPGGFEPGGGRRGGAGA